MEHTNIDILVVGAGLSGLMAASILQKSGYRVTVLEKDPDIGGRALTLRIGNGLADVGAQFFTIRSSEFRSWVQQWEYEKVVSLWSTGFSHDSFTQASDGHPRYIANGGMSALAYHLAHDLDDVRAGLAVMTATPTGENWLVQNEEGDIFTAQALVLTAPVPQSLAVLRAGATHLSDNDTAALNRIQYWPCVCGLFAIQGPLHLPEPGAVQRPNAPISWIADNHRKGISQTTLVTVHASSDYSRRIWGSSDESILADLRDSLRPYIEPSTKIEEAHLIRWQYSVPTIVHPAPYLLAEFLPPLIFAGDAFAGPRIEGAVMSGFAAAQKLLRVLES